MLSTPECCASSAGINKSTHLKPPFHTRANRQSRGLSKVAATPEPQHALSFLSSEQGEVTRSPEDSSCLQLLVTNLFFSFSEVTWKSPPRKPLHFAAVLLRYPSIKIFQNDKSHSHYFSFFGVGKGKKSNARVYLKSCWILIIANVF